MIIQLPMNSIDFGGGNNDATITFQPDAGQRAPCLLEAFCTTCSHEQCQEKVEELEEDIYLVQNLTLFGTELEYKCPLGQEFLTDGGTEPKITRTCHWNQSWDGSDNFTCVCMLILFCSKSRLPSGTKYSFCIAKG